MKLRIPKGYQLGTARPDDIPEMFDLLKQHYSRYTVAPSIDLKSFTHMVSHYPGLSLDDFYLARKNGRLESMVALWDQSPLQKMVVTGFDKKSKLIVGLMRALGYVATIPRIPRVGEQLKSKMAFCTAVRDPQSDALRAVLRYAHNKMRGSEFSFFTIHFNERDPLNASIKGMIASDTRIHLFACSLQDQSDDDRFNPESELYHFELATTI